ncbi:MAG: glutamine-hydrolyzing GMP synthase [Candidatus Peribacter sp.]|jgi:GMP synthase (glutamine-hydrolysing)|nr:glutamine-hydrolyzing GMP synthase [Candidatus Peribacter sp.]MBT4393297.1 glutamine-hydrolyzing GMP synthase [Candidatus Peribacter sp.]MBT4601192.1 glutamine-hydrolyzing GMP synthase [Candidatus Peribacter sp.]MBT5148848.1 glutamine-hydrolyzing GMP synthase [Candidatus Peribacter sp.]MBT5637272.1 glutamine-hydrolyzing GMP synthase [Candidatus Peribacter sp.]
MEHNKSIVVLDFGGQYAHLIARRVRQCGVYSEIKDAETSAEELKGAAGIILSGGPQSVYDPKSPQGDPALFDLGIPVLGICYGLHWMTKALGGEVSEGKTKEYGKTKIHIEDSEWSEADGIPQDLTVWMSHGDEVSKLPDGFTRVATSDACANAGFTHKEKKFFAVQFHPEVTHTEYGEQMLANFVKQCDADPWSIKSYTEHIGEYLKKEVGDRKVFMLVSGGVDSTVAFVLLNKVLGEDRVQGLYVDTGMMRKDETVQIKKAFDALGINNLRIEDASEYFIKKLTEVYEPEAKRWIIGDAFLSVQKRVSEEMNLKMEDGWMLGQGTIYPDTIETGETKNADKIKTHHNRIPEIQKMMEEGFVVEPLRELYKDEVRALGEELGLPHDLVWRHPFPGPGLGVRILCAKEAEHATDTLDISIAHAPLPIKSVGVQGDGRSYRHAVALFNDQKFANAECWDLSTSIPNASEDFNRVLMCTSHTSAPEFVFSPGYITASRAEILRDADAIAHEEMVKAGLYESIWQFPVVLLPFGTTEGGVSIVLRPVESQEAMTANAVDLPKEVVVSMTKRLLSLDGVDIVFQDLTHKPPGTIEWE